jgi:hypothetical protein
LKIDGLKGKLREFKNSPQEFLQGEFDKNNPIPIVIQFVALIETLEADVRSKFQTKRRKADAVRGLQVEVPFDNAFVKFYWLDDRVLEIVSVSLFHDEDAVEGGIRSELGLSVELEV